KAESIDKYRPELEKMNAFIGSIPVQVSPCHFDSPPHRPLPCSDSGLGRLLPIRRSDDRVTYTPLDPFIHLEFTLCKPQRFPWPRGPPTWKI
ncbi:MAG: hypothetical protein ABSF34_17925, partial [Verrucomicrobiota bacterium]